MASQISGVVLAFEIRTAVWGRGNCYRSAAPDESVSFVCSQHPRSNDSPGINIYMHHNMDQVTVQYHVPYVLAALNLYTIEGG